LRISSTPAQRKTPVEADPTTGVFYSGHQAAFRERSRVSRVAPGRPPGGPVEGSFLDTIETKCRLEG